MPLPDNVHDLVNLIEQMVLETDRADLQIRVLDPKFQDYIALFKQANNLLAFYNVPFKITETKLSKHRNFRKSAGRNFKNPEIVRVTGETGGRKPRF